MRAPTTTRPGPLADDAARRYWQDGYLFPIQAVSDAQARAWRAEFEQIEATWRDADLPLPLNTYKRINAHCVIPLAHRIAADPRLLDAVESILGPDLLIWSVEFFIKEPGTAARVSMHQDLTYWGFGAVDHLLTAWLALSPATPQTGCMNFVRASHKNPILPHEDTCDAENLLSRGQEIRVDVAPQDRVPASLRPGQMSLHHGLMIHGSGANQGDDRRIGVAIRYCTPEIAQQVAEKDYAILARGADRSGNFINFAPPSAPFSPASLALYDEIRQAQAQALMQNAAQDRKGFYS